LPWLAGQSGAQANLAVIVAVIRYGNGRRSGRE